VSGLQPAVARLLERSGFALFLVDCHDRGVCSKPVTDELILRIVPGRNRTRPAICGEAMHGSEGRRSVLMTVYRDCVSSVTAALHEKALRPKPRADLLKLKPADVLAPILIHEALHLLLPGEAHGSGLWKGVLDLSDWERAAHAQLGLEPRTAARVRDALAGRGARAGTY
jgi:hypothetical protein